MSSDIKSSVRFHASPSALALADPRAPLPPLRQATAPKAPSDAEATSLLADEHPEPSPTVSPSHLELEAARRQHEEQLAIRRVLDSLNAAAGRYEETQRRHLDEWQRSAVELAVTIAARLVHDSIRAGDFAVEEVVRSAIELLGPRGPFAVRLHPADVTLLETRLGGETLATSADAVTVTADASIERGGCTVEAPEATVTSRLAEQLATMREELLRSLADADAGR